MGIPRTDEHGIYHIKLSALGGDGANTAAKLLVETAVLDEDLNGAYDAKYGSEKKGTPTDVSIRLAAPDTPIREAGPCNRPHLLGIFHVSLIKPLRLNAGLREDAVVVVNTTKSPAEIRDILELHSGTIACLDAVSIARDNSSRLNMPMIAAVNHVAGLVPADKLIEYVKRKWPAVAENNEKAFRDAADKIVVEKFEADGKYPLVEPIAVETPIGWKNQPIGGHIPVPATSVVRDHTASRTGYRPKWHADKCIHCALCETTCSDPGAILWEEGKMVGIDYTYCKGCFRCVAICPKGAITKEKE